MKTMNSFVAAPVPLPGSVATPSPSTPGSAGFAMEVIEAEGVTVQAIPVAPSAKEAVKTIIATVIVPDLLEGDVVRLDGTFQITNDLHKSSKPFNVGCASQFRMEPLAARGLTMAAGANVTPDNHHFSYTRFGFHKVTASGTQEYHLVVWAHSSKVKAADKLVLRVDRVHLAATVYRGRSSSTVEGDG